MDRGTELKKIADAVSICRKCELHHFREKGVPGEGPADAEIMFIGEGPGFHENVQGRPFVGAAGNLLVELLAGIGMKREQVFITNVIKCRPPENRDPEPGELSACNPYLEKQLQIINPKVVVTLGRYSMAKFMPNAKISEVHGKPVNVRGMLVIPFFHPAAALHRQSLRPVLEEDFNRLPELIQGADEAPAYHPQEPFEDDHPAEQLSMF